METGLSGLGKIPVVQGEAEIDAREEIPDYRKYLGKKRTVPLKDNSWDPQQCHITMPSVLSMWLFYIQIIWVIFFYFNETLFSIGSHWQSTFKKKKEVNFISVVARQTSSFKQWLQFSHSMLGNLCAVEVGFYFCFYPSDLLTAY